MDNEQNLYKEFYELLSGVDYISLIIDMLYDDGKESNKDDTLTPEQKQASWDVYHRAWALISAIDSASGGAE